MDRATEAQARAFHEMTQVGGPWSPCSGPFGVPMECLCYEMATDALKALSVDEGGNTAPREATDDERCPTCKGANTYYRPDSCLNLWHVNAPIGVGS